MPSGTEDSNEGQMTSAIRIADSKQSHNSSDTVLCVAFPISSIIIILPDFNTGA